MAPSLWLPRTAGPRFLWLVRHGQSEANVLRDDAELRGDAHATRPARDADVETPTNGLLVGAHDIVVQLTVALLTGLDESATVAQVRGTKYANCGLAMLRRDDDGYQVIAYNSTAPVQEQGTPPTEEADAS